MVEKAAQRVSLAGDGDEIAAINEVEATFDVKLDYADAPRWRTAGDVFCSLLKVLPSDDVARPDKWERFAKALSRGTGLDPHAISKQSVLIDDTNIWTPIADLSAIVWLIAIGIVLVGVAAAFAFG